MERRNIVFGLWWLLAFSILGSILEIWLGQTNFVTPLGMEGARHALKTAHTHALCLSFASILFGLSADVVAKPGKTRTIASWLIVMGVALFPLGVTASVFIAEPLVYLTPLGGFLFISGLATALFSGLAKTSK